MAHSTTALGKAAPEVAFQPRNQGSFFVKTSSAGSFRDSLKTASAQASNQLQQTVGVGKKAETASTQKVSREDVENLYKQFFSAGMFKLMSLPTPDRYTDEDD